VWKKIFRDRASGRWASGDIGYEGATTMSGEVSPMLWFLFWVGLSVGVLSFGFFMAIVIHRGNMKALEVLRTYAEKGIEPPPAIVEMLTNHLCRDETVQSGRDLGTKAGKFTGMVASACAAGAIA
jgi:hypothetical protein